MTLRSASITASIALVGMLAASAASAADPASPPVMVVPRMMLAPSEEARLQAAADRGIDALRQYVWRTRSIYNYYLPELLG